MTKKQLARWRNLGFEFPEFYDTIAKDEVNLDKVEEEEKDKLKINALDSIAEIDFIDQNLLKGKKNSANGFYYLYDGTFLGNYGISKEVVVCAKKSDREDKKSKNKWQEFLSPSRLVIENEDFIYFSATIFAESLMGYEITIKEEVFAFANAIGNYVEKIKKDKKREISYSEAINENGVYGADSPNHKNFVKEKDRNSNSKMKLAISGVINELTNGFDYSYGALRWDGIDIKNAKWKEGLKFAQDSHDVFGLKDNKNEGKELWDNPGKKDDIWLRQKWEYVNISTVAYSGENKKKKNPYYPYYKDDKVNQNMFATTFVKYHPDFENIIPNQTVKDE